MARKYCGLSLGAIAFFSVYFVTLLPSGAQSFQQDFLKTPKLPANSVTTRPDCGDIEHVSAYGGEIRKLAFDVGDAFVVRTTVLNCAGKDLTAGFHLRYHLVPEGVGPIDDANFGNVVFRLPRAGSFKLGRKVKHEGVLRTTRTLRWDSQVSGQFRLVACPAKFDSSATTVGLRRNARRCGIIAWLDVNGPPRADVSLRDGAVVGTYSYWSSVRPKVTIENHGNIAPRGTSNKISFSMRAEARNTGGQSAQPMRSFIRTWTLPNGFVLNPGNNMSVPNTAPAILKPVRLGNGHVAPLMEYRITARASFSNDQVSRNNSTVATARAAPNDTCEAALYWVPSSVSKTVRVGNATGALQFDMANTGKTACAPFRLVVRRRRGQEGSSNFNAWQDIRSSSGASNTVVSIGAIEPLGFIRVVFRDREALNQPGLYQYALFPHGPHPDSRTWNHSGAENGLAIPVR